MLSNILKNTKTAPLLKYYIMMTLPQVNWNYVFIIFKKKQAKIILYSCSNIKFHLLRNIYCKINAYMHILKYIHTTDTQVNTYT